jgi:hypothetical protein
MGVEEPGSPQGTARRVRPSRARARFLPVLATCLVTALGLAVWLALDARVARTSLEAAATELAVLKAQVIEGDDGAASSLDAVQEHSARARAATDGPHWWLAAHTPFVGPTVDGVRTVAAVVDDLATDALPALADARSAVDPASLTPVNGRIGLQPLIDAAPAVVAADDAVQSGAERLAALPTDRMVGVVSGPVEDVRAQVDELAATTATASRVVQILPPMLGADGPRTYAVLVQGNSEIRSLGGMPGVVILLTADDGAVRYVGEWPASEFVFDEPVLRLTDEELNLYTEILGLYLADVTMTPDFPRAAELARAMIAAKKGTTVDGVLAVDPVALGGVLAATGPVTTPSGTTLTAENASDYLLHDVYREVPVEAEQDAFFAETARAVFRALAAGHADPGRLARGLAAAAEDGRLLAWSADEGEEALIARTPLGGELRGADGDSPVIGVYLNSGTAAKIDHFLDYGVGVEQVACTGDGRAVFGLTVDLTSTVPDGGTLPEYVSGSGEFVPEGVIRTNVAVYAPVGGWIESVDTEGRAEGIASYVHAGLDVGVQTVDLDPGETETLRLTIIGGTQPRPVLVRMTPGPNAANLSVQDSAPCR